MTKSPPAFPKGVLFVQEGILQKEIFREIQRLMPHILVEKTFDVSCIKYIPTDNPSTRLWIATQLAAGDAGSYIGWAQDVPDAVIKQRVNLYYRIAEALIEGEHATTEWKEKEG